MYVAVSGDLPADSLRKCWYARIIEIRGDDFLLVYEDTLLY
jgi:hypothetical protein